jgi:hypothetical protein
MLHLTCVLPSAANAPPVFSATLPISCTPASNTALALSLRPMPAPSMAVLLLKVLELTAMRANCCTLMAPPDSLAAH